MVWRSELRTSFCVPFFSGPHIPLHGTCLAYMQQPLLRLTETGQRLRGSTPDGFGDGLRPLNHSNRALSTAPGSPDTSILQLLGPDLERLREEKGNYPSTVALPWFPLGLFQKRRFSRFYPCVCVCVTISQGSSSGSRSIRCQ